MEGQLLILLGAGSVITALGGYVIALRLFEKAQAAFARPNEQSQSSSAA